MNLPAGKLEAGKNYVQFNTISVPILDDNGNKLTTQGQLDIEFSEPNPPAGYIAVPNYLGQSTYIANYIRRLCQQGADIQISQWR